jgi:hypothetical protein
MSPANCNFAFTMPRLKEAQSERAHHVCIDKTRKILWARSGNRSAVCRQKPVVDQTLADPESVVGEECHINAQSGGGARHDGALAPDQIDSLDNLILLCASHDKMVDDQPQLHTAHWLRGKKIEHEKWVDAQLSAKDDSAPVRIVRKKSAFPSKLDRITSGKDLLRIAEGCQANRPPQQPRIGALQVEHDRSAAVISAQFLRVHGKDAKTATLPQASQKSRVAVTELEIVRLLFAPDGHPIVPTVNRDNASPLRPGFPEREQLRRGFQPH